MMNLYILLILIISPFLMFAQRNYSNSVSIGLNYAILGEGDYEAWIYQNQYAIEVFDFIEGTISVGFLSSHFEEEYLNNSTQSFVRLYEAQHFTADFSVHLIPIIIADKVYLKLGGGFSLRNRKEINAQSLYIEDRKVWIEWLYAREKNWDTGYHIHGILGGNLSQRIFLNGQLSLAHYNQGTQTVSFGIIGGYRF